MTATGDRDVADAGFAQRCHRTIDADLDAVNCRDRAALKEVPDGNACRVDWAVSAYGRDAMLAATASIVDDATLHITVRGVRMDLPRAMADQSVPINGAIALEVLDLFTFRPAGGSPPCAPSRGPEHPVSSGV